MSSSNAIYLQFNSIISEQQEKTKNLNKKISGYKEKIISGENTISLEKEIEDQIASLKEAHRELENAYSNKNAPSQIALQELDRRQKEIKKLEISINESDKNYKDLKGDKYEFKGNDMEEYVPTDEMKTMDNAQLMQLQKKKIDDQNEQLNDIVLDVKKGQVLVKEAGKMMEDQDKELDELQKDMEQLDSRINRGTQRFKEFAAKQSGWCVVLILILEVVAFFLIYFLM